MVTPHRTLVHVEGLWWRQGCDVLVAGRVSRSDGTAEEMPFGTLRVRHALTSVVCYAPLGMSLSGL